MRNYLSSLLLLAGLVGSSAGCAVRVYDGPRGDYHRWDGHEEQVYRVYLTEQHREYRDYKRLDRGDQERYWEWRHAHPDRDRDRDHDRR